MGRRVFMMSVKKRNEIKREQERLEREERKKMEAILGRTFSGKPVSQLKRAKPQRDYTPEPPVTRQTPEIKSSFSTTGLSNACAKKAPNVYTGTAILGVAVMHKSNVVPVFSKEDAIAISSMRR